MENEDYEQKVGEERIIEKVEQNGEKMKGDQTEKIEIKQQLQKERSEKQVHQLRLRVKELQAENKKLKSRIADFQPHKQKVLRAPNKKKIEDLFSSFKTKKVALKICYLGFTYDGMAYQQDSDNTVESHLFKALHTLSLIPNETPGGDYTRAGRTDKGVSAMGNVISLRLRSNDPIQISQQQENKKKTKPVSYCSMLNAILPEDIRILANQQVQDDFNARYWCTQRSYKYFFAKNNMNIEAMKEGIKYFEGTHNFINFCKINLANTVNFQRTIFSASIEQSHVSQIYQNQANQIYYFYYVGNSFLWHQIRFMSAILFLIGTGKQDPIVIKHLLDIEKYPRKPNYPMAPEYPLILQDCQYPQIKLIPEKQTVFNFYQTFNEIIMRKSVEKTLVINCIMMAQRDLIKNGNITMDVYLQQLRNRFKNKNLRAKRLEMHKSSGRSLQEAMSSLKGKKKQLFQKKKQKQEQYERRVQQQREQHNQEVEQKQISE